MSDSFASSSFDDSDKQKGIETELKDLIETEKNQMEFNSQVRFIHIAILRLEYINRKLLIFFQFNFQFKNIDFLIDPKTEVSTSC